MFFPIATFVTPSARNSDTSNLFSFLEFALTDGLVVELNQIYGINIILLFHRNKQTIHDNAPYH
jgi:hypothetical protein